MNPHWVTFAGIALGRGWLFAALPLFLLATYFFIRHDSVTFLRRFFFLLCGFLPARAVLLTIFTYRAWSSAPPGRYLLPPYQPLSYFLGYSFTHYGASLALTVLALSATVTFFAVFAQLRHKSNEPPWSAGDVYIFLSGALLLRWPLIIPYLFLGIALGIGYLLALITIRKQKASPLNLGPFFAGLTLVLLIFDGFFIDLFSLRSLVMPL